MGVPITHAQPCPPARPTGLYTYIISLSSACMGVPWRLVWRVGWRRGARGAPWTLPVLPMCCLAWWLSGGGWGAGSVAQFARRMPLAKTRSHGARCTPQHVHKRHASSLSRPLPWAPKVLRKRMWHMNPGWIAYSLPQLSACRRGILWPTSIPCSTSALARTSPLDQRRTKGGGGTRQHDHIHLTARMASQDSNTCLEPLAQRRGSSGLCH